MNPHEAAGCIVLAGVAVGLCVFGALIGGLLVAIGDRLPLLVGSAGAALGIVGLVVSVRGRV